MLSELLGLVPSTTACGSQLLITEPEDQTVSLGLYRDPHRHDTHMCDVRAHMHVRATHTNVAFVSHVPSYKKAPDQFPEIKVGCFLGTNARVRNAEQLVTRIYCWKQNGRVSHLRKAEKMTKKEVTTCSKSYVFRASPNGGVLHRTGVNESILLELRDQQGAGSL